MVAHLSSISLRGFKTFARRTELVLQPGVTVVIGPNGSGKSNIADAVLWVLGEQSPGNLRGRSMQDVIFSGPDGRKSSAVAEVSLVFDNECGTLPLDCNQVEITRRVVRDGASEYRINGSACRLLDVQDLIGGLGLGREMHSVISQGKVDALLNSTPEARRALVEEAAGLGRFKKRRERAQVKLERTRQNLLRVSDVEREVKNSLRPLRQQVAAAERFAQATEEWALARGRLVVFELAVIQDSFAETGRSLEALLARRGELEARLATLRKQRADEEEQFTGILQQREELSSSYHRVRSEAERLESRAVELRQRVARNEGELDRARRRREMAENELASLNRRIEQLAVSTSDEARLSWVSEAASKLRSSVDEAMPAYKQAVQEEDDLKDRVFELESARSRALQDRDFLRREVEQKGRIGHEVQELARGAVARVQDLETEAADRQEELGRLHQNLVEAMADFDRADEREKAAHLAEQETALREAHLTELMAGLEARQTVLRDVLERREGLPVAAKELMLRAPGSKLLTEILAVEAGYERALAAALGPIVQSVILSDKVDVQSALDGAGPREVLWESETAGMAEPARPTGAAPPGTRDLWEVVSGPESVLRSLKRLVAPTAVLTDGQEISTEFDRATWREWRVVSRSGDVITRGIHAARRTEAGAEAQLRAKNELLRANEEHEAAARDREQAAREAQAAAAQAREAEALRRAAEERQREAERSLLAVKNEVDLQARRLEEARLQVAELADRQQREAGLVAKMQADLAEAESVIIAREAELEQMRGALRSAQGKSEALRRDAARLEEKRSQAALIEVKLRERCRAQETERRRAADQRQSAEADLARCTAKMQMRAAYGPGLADLLSVVERLAARAGQSAHELQLRVDESRTQSEAATRSMRDRGGAENELQRELDEVAALHAGQQVEHVRFDERRMVLEDELADLRRKHMSPRGLKPEDLAGESREVLEAAAVRAEQRRDRIGPVNPLAEQECAEMEERARFLAEQRADLEASIDQLQEVIGGLDEHINGSFAEIFGSIRENFAAVIATVFPGAKGTLSLSEKKPASRETAESGENTLDEELEAKGLTDTVPGISLSVKFPNKAPRSMSLLSGGEKAMTAIAFLFSLFLAHPCPFYLLDEVEASLDDVNIRRFLSLVRKYRDRTQFIVITHQRQTMEVADTLYGVTMESDGVSRVLSRRLGDKKQAHDEKQRGPLAEPLAKEA